MKKGKKGMCCTHEKIAWFLVVIGAVNWGLVGLGMLLGGKNWNLVNLIFGGMPAIEAIVYILVGISAVAMLMGCKCKGRCGDCKDGKCDTHGKKEGGMKMEMKEEMPAEEKAADMPMSEGGMDMEENKEEGMM